jgi:hypothetical protein
MTCFRRENRHLLPMKEGYSDLVTRKSDASKERDCPPPKSAPPDGDLSFTSPLQERLYSEMGKVQIAQRWRMDGPKMLQDSYRPRHFSYVPSFAQALARSFRNERSGSLSRSGSKKSSLPFHWEWPVYLSKLTRSVDKDQTSVVQRCRRDHSCGKFEQTLVIARFVEFSTQLEIVSLP